MTTREELFTSLRKALIKDGLRLLGGIILTSAIFKLAVHLSGGMISAASESSGMGYGINMGIMILGSFSTGLLILVGIFITIVGLLGCCADLHDYWEVRSRLNEH